MGLTTLNMVVEGERVKDLSTTFKRKFGGLKWGE